VWPLGVASHSSARSWIYGGIDWSHLLRPGIRLDGCFHCSNSMKYVWMVVFTVPTRFQSCKYKVPSASAEMFDSSVSPGPGSVHASMQPHEASGPGFGCFASPCSRLVPPLVRFTHGSRQSRKSPPASSFSREAWRAKPWMPAWGRRPCSRWEAWRPKP